VKPIKTTVFPASEIGEALRFLGSGKHMGKVLLQMRENDNDQFSLPLLIHPTVHCQLKMTYVSLFHRKSLEWRISKFFADFGKNTKEVPIKINKKIFFFVPSKCQKSHTKSFLLPF
jgi:hypothetical protein